MPKITCECVSRFSISFLREHTNLPKLSKNGCTDRSYVQVWQNTSKTKNAEEKFLHNIELVTTPCYFGGRRFWFKCPKCQKPTLTLYKHGQNFWCRKCCGLVYASQQRPHTGKYALLEKVIFRDWHEEENKIRTKFHCGKPTRRYQRFLDRMEKNLSPEILQSLEFLFEKRRKIN